MSSASEQQVQTEFREISFVKQDLEGHQVHFQVLNLGRQLYVWASTGGEMNNLAIAMPTPHASQGPASQVLPGRGSETAERVARRLTKEMRQPVAVSWNLKGDDMLHLWAEKELMLELRVLGLAEKSEALKLNGT